MTEAIVGGVRSMLSLLSGVGPSSNLRLGDFHDLVVAMVVGSLAVVLKAGGLVVVVVEGLTDRSRCWSSFKTSVRLVVCWISGASVGWLDFNCKSSNNCDLVDLSVGFAVVVLDFFNILIISDLMVP